MPNYLRLTGSADSYIKFEPAKISIYDFTMSCWLRLAPPKQSQTIFSWKDGEGDYVEFLINPDCSLTLDVNILGKDIRISTKPLTDLFDNKWHLVSAVIQPTGHSLKTLFKGNFSFYVDAKNRFSDNISLDPFAPKVSEELVIGGGVNNNLGLSGDITDFRLWNRALDPTTLLQNMRTLCGKDDPDLAIYLPLLGNGRGSGGEVLANTKEMVSGKEVTLGPGCTIGYTPDLTLNALTELEHNTPSAPFPDFTTNPGLKASYEYLSNQAQPGNHDLRSLYTEETVDPNNWLININNIPTDKVPNDLAGKSTLDQWQTVYKEIKTEIENLNNFRSFFTAYNTFYNSVNLQISNRLNEAVAKMSVNGNALQVNSDFSVWVEITCAAISMVPDVGSALSFYLKALSMLEKTTPQGDVENFSQQFQTVAASLWDELNTSFQSSTTNGYKLQGNMEKDYGLMQTAANYISSGELVFSDVNRDKVLAAMESSCEKYFAQTLMVAKYVIFSFSNRWHQRVTKPCCDAPDNIPADAINSGYTTLLGYKIYYYDVIGQGSSDAINDVPPQSLFDYLTGLGFTKDDWFSWIGNTVGIECGFSPPVI